MLGTEPEAAIEVKGSRFVHGSELKGLRAFHDEHRPRRSIVVCNEPEPRQMGALTILPWRVFFERLWAGEVI